MNNALEGADNAFTRACGATNPQTTIDENVLFLYASTYPLPFRWLCNKHQRLNKVFEDKS